MRCSAILLCLAAFVPPATADTVHLVNGNRFEDVVAEAGDGEVRVRMPYGEIVLPSTVVARIERAASPWQEFDARQALLRGGPSTASQWLELARWARASGYERGAREALLEAARLDPRLAGLAPLMGQIGYILERESGEWLPEADYMRRRGYRLWDGEWLPLTEYEARLGAQREADKRRRDDDRQERIARALEALVVAQLARASEPEPEAEPLRNRAPLVAVYTGAYVPYLAPRSGPVPPVVSDEQATFEDLVGRPPGSLFPILPRRHLTSSE